MIKAQRSPVDRRIGRGFTLLEVLIAVAIVAVIAVLGYRALAALSSSEERLSAEATRWQTLDLFFARLEGDLRQAIPRSARADAAQEPAWFASTDAAGNASLAFSRAGPEFSLESASAGQRLAYRFRDGTVEILYWSGYDRPRGAAAATYTLLSDVTQFRVAYLMPSGAWVDHWPAGAATATDADMPRGVRVDLTLASGELIERWLALR